MTTFLSRLFFATLILVSAWLPPFSSSAQVLVPSAAPGRLPSASATRPATRSAPPRHLAEQLARSVDAGDSYAAPGTRQSLRRLPGVVAIPSTGRADSRIDRLTRPGAPLAGYTLENHYRSGVAVLAAPTSGAPRAARADRDATSLRETLRQTRRTPDGATANPVFIDPKTGLRLLATTRLIVRLQPGADSRRHFGDAWRNVSPLWGTTDQFLLDLPAASAETIFAEVDRQTSLPDVVWAEPDFIGQVIKASVPNDTLFGDQWHLQNTGQWNATAGADAKLPGAWDLTTGSSNIVIAILDDGVQLDHPDLAGNIFRNTTEIADNGIDEDQNGVIDDVQGYNFVVNLPDANPYTDDDNHGTAVAGVAAAVGNNSEGATGAAQRCRILPVKVLEGDSAASTSGFARALRYAAGLNSAGQSVWRGADVVNISLAFSQHLVTDAALADVVLRGRNGLGSAVFVAAGNYASAWEPVYFDVEEADTYTLRFEYSKDNVDTFSVGADTVWIDSIRFPDGSLETFEGGLPQDWVTSSFSPWRIVTNGVGGNLALTGWNGPNSRSLRAGRITHNQTNFVEYTTFLTPGTLVVWCLVSSEYQYDYFDFWVGRNGTDTLIFSQSGVPIPEPVVGYPANNQHTIAVGASTDFDYRADYSQYGTPLDFVAPSDGGVSGIVTTDRTGTNGYSNGDYVFEFGGTSSSTPLASGIAALVLSLNPHLTAAELKSQLRSTCDRIGGVTYDAAGRNTFYGSGRLNAARAVSQARPNLRVTLTIPSVPISTGDLTTYTIEVRNNGLSRSGNVTVTNPIPTGASFISASPAPTSQAGGRLTFAGSALAAGGSWTISVTISNQVAGTKTLLAGAFNDVVEPSLSDNVASGTLVVQPTPAISVGDATVVEGLKGKTNAIVQVTLSNPSSRKITVGFATVTNTALAGQDFAPVQKILTFNPGQTNIALSIGVVGDSRNEADETFFVRLQNAVNAFLADDTGMVTILNDDTVPVVSAPPVIRKEGNSGYGKAVFRFRLSAASGRIVTVDYATQPGTAQSGVDFLATNGVLTFLPGKTTANAIVLIPGDKVLETNETFALVLSNPVNAQLDSNAIDCTILNNDPLPKLYVDDRGLPEGNITNTIAVQVRLATPSELPVTVFYATTNGTAQADFDYAGTNGMLTFAPGETNQSVLVNILGDSLRETLEYFSVRIMNPTNALIARALGRVSLTNDDVFITVGGNVVVAPVLNSYPPRPTLAGHLEGESFVLTFPSVSGLRYSIETADELAKGAMWRAIESGDVTGTGQEIRVVVPRVVAPAQRFYRVVADPGL